MKNSQLIVSFRAHAQTNAILAMQECTIEDIGRFWQILAILYRIFALFVFLFTGLHSAVYQN